MGSWRNSLCALGAPAVKSTARPAGRSPPPGRPPQAGRRRAQIRAGPPSGSRQNARSRQRHRWPGPRGDRGTITRTSIHSPGHRRTKWCRVSAARRADSLGSSTRPTPVGRQRVLEPDPRQQRGDRVTTLPALHPPADAPPADGPSPAPSTARHQARPSVGPVGPLQAGQCQPLELPSVRDQAMGRRAGGDVALRQRRRPASRGPWKRSRTSTSDSTHRTVRGKTERLRGQR